MPRLIEQEQQEIIRYLEADSNHDHFDKSLYFLIQWQL